MPKLAKGEKLTIKEALFCLQYVRHFNATQAAIAAGYSKKSAHYQGSDILHRPRVKAELKRLLAHHGMTSEEILARLSEMARGNIGEIIELCDVPVLDREGNHVGNVQSIRFKQDAFERFGHLIKSIRPLTSGEFQIELHDPLRALELLGKAYGLFR